MDELNQIQNPNMPSAGGSMGPMPSMSPMPAKSKSVWLWVVIAVVLVVAGVAWWYINQMTVEPVVQQGPSVNQEAREDMMINKDIQATDSTDVDSEFKAIDSDINSL